MRKSIEYKPGQTVEYMEKTFTKICDVKDAPDGTPPGVEIWQDPDCDDYTPTSGFMLGNTPPAFVPVVD
jgi:hypothetical protein